MNHEQTGPSTALTNGETIRDAYEKTSKAVQTGYNRTVAFGTEHPQQFGLLTFAVGLGAGTLLAARTLAARTHTERLASPVIDAVANVARAFVSR
jgi:hypothetical protein